MSGDPMNDEPSTADQNPLSHVLVTDMAHDFRYFLEIRGYLACNVNTLCESLSSSILSEQNSDILPKNSVSDVSGTKKLNKEIVPLKRALVPCSFSIRYYGLYSFRR